MSYVNQKVYDHGLLWLATHTTRLIVVSAGGFTTYADAVAALLGEKADIVVNGPSNSGNGRKVSVPEITDGAVSADGTIASWALLGDGVSELLVLGGLLLPKPVVAGNTFTLPAFDIIIPGIA
jgi:hypothetical protein